MAWLLFLAFVHSIVLCAIRVVLGSILFWKHMHNKDCCKTQHYNKIKYSTTTRHSTTRLDTRHNAIQYNTTQHSTTQHNTTQYSTTQHNTAQHNTTQHNTTQHTQHNTTQHSTTQHNTTQHDYFGILHWFILYKVTRKSTRNKSALTFQEQEQSRFRKLFWKFRIFENLIQ